MKPYRIIIFSILSSLLLFSTPGFTYSGDTHIELNKKAVNISVLVIESYLNNQLGFSEGIEEVINEKKVRVWIMDGGAQEDESFRYRNHFHNPLKEDWKKAGLSDVFSGTSSIIWAQDINQEWSWKNARDYYHLALTSATKEERDQNFAHMFRALGQVMHLIEDSAVPAHSRNDTHVADSYENWVKGAELGSFLESPIEFDKEILDIPPNPLAPIPIARIVDTDKYTKENPEVGTGNKIGLSEYTNYHFLSDDTIFTDNKPTTDKHYFPHPDLEEDTNWGTIVAQITKAEDGKVDKVKYVSSITEPKLECLAGVTLSKHIVKKLRKDPNVDIREKFWLRKGFSGKYDKCLENYAQLLLPRAAGYSAGLLNYFFRGKLDATRIPVEGGVPNERELKITNKSDENMTNGTLTFLYENEYGVYIELKSQSGVNIDAGEEYEGEFRFNMPQEVINYILVFRGKLGQEEDAVAGKVAEGVPPEVRIEPSDPGTLKAYASDGENGSGIDRVEFWDGPPDDTPDEAPGVRLGIDDHDVTYSESEEKHTYTIDYDGTLSDRLYAKAFDQAGNTIVSNLPVVEDTCVCSYSTDSNSSDYYRAWVAHEQIDQESPYEPGVELWSRIFWKFPVSSRDFLHLRISGVSDQRLVGAGGFTLSLYAIEPSSYDTATLTWANQPPLGELLWSQTYAAYEFPGSGSWVSIPISKRSAVCLLANVNQPRNHNYAICILVYTNEAGPSDRPYLSNEP